jgi:predicted DNA-binding protein (UPF0278 family)
MPAEAKIVISAKSRAYLRRLSVVLAYDLRLTIVTELFLREMSPSQFYREFGGGSAARVERHFKRLAEYGWLRLVREESGGRRRGGCEHFYRATELAILDLETFSLFPYSIRAAFSWTTFKQLATRFREALEAGTFDASPDRQLDLTSLDVDELGRERVIGALDSLFDALQEEQAEARLRIFESGEKPLLMTVGLAAFESPGVLRDALGVPCLAEGVDSLAPACGRLSKVVADEVCLSILDELNWREMSVTQYHRELGGASKPAIRYRFEMLEKIGCLVKVGKMPRDGRRGPREHVYRAAGPALAEDGVWSGLPDSIEASDEWRVFTRLADEVKEAISAGTLDARPDRHLTWLLLSLDMDGWQKAIAAIDAALAFVAEEREGAALCLAESGDVSMTMTVAALAFGSPRGSEKP